MITAKLCEECGSSGIVALGNGQYENCRCGAFSNLTWEEQIDQGARCSCMGTDDYCPCQNVPDAATRKARAANAKEPRTNFANALGLATYLSEIASGSDADLVVVKRDAIRSAIRLIKDHRQYSQAKRNARSLSK